MASLCLDDQIAAPRPSSSSTEKNISARKNEGKSSRDKLGRRRQTDIRGGKKVKNNRFARRANQLPLLGETQFSVIPPSNALVVVSVSDP